MRGFVSSLFCVAFGVFSQLACYLGCAITQMRREKQLLMIFVLQAPGASGRGGQHGKCSRWEPLNATLGAVCRASAKYIEFCTEVSGSPFTSAQPSHAGPPKDATSLSSARAGISRGSL